MLFREGAGTSDKPLRPGQRLFDWINDSSWPVVAIGRTFVNEWLGEYPEPHRTKLIQHVLNDDDRRLTDCLFELYMFTLLRRQGFGVTPEPELPSGRNADFKVAIGETPLCFLEATVNHGIPTINDHDAQVERILDEVGPFLRCPGRSIMVHEAAAGQTHPSPRRMAQIIQAWLDEPAPAADRSTEEVELVEPVSGWKLVLSTIPLNDPDLQHESPFGVRSGGVNFIPNDLVRGEVRKKLRQTKGAPLPVVVAVALHNPLVAPDERAIVAELAGDERWAFPRKNPDAGEWRRARNGLWTEPGRSAVTRCPAIVLTRDCCLWALDKIEPVLWANPVTSLPLLESNWLPSRRFWPDLKGQLERACRTPASDVLGLSELFANARARTD